MTPGQFPPRTIAPWTIALWTIALGQFSPRRIAPCTILPDNSHLGLLYCPLIIIPGKLLPRAMAISYYNFSCLFSVSFSWPNYISSVFDYDNKQNGHNFAKQNNFLKRFSNIKITGNIKIKLTSSFPASNYLFKVNNRNTRTIW